MTPEEANAIKDIKTAINSVKAAGWTSPSIMIHDVNLRSLKKFYADDLRVTTGFIEDAWRTYVSGDIKELSGVTFFDGIPRVKDKEPN